MVRTITDDVVGNEVVDAQNETVGIVTAVKHGTAYVDPDPGLTDKFKAKLNWEDADQDDYPLQEATISTITDDEIRLQYNR